MTRLLVLSKYGSLAASPRYRFQQFEPGLRALGIELCFSPLLDNDYLADRLTNERVRPGAVVRGLFRRARDLLAATTFDALWLHCELVPYAPPLVEQLLASRGIPYVYDFDDAIFHGYDQHPALPVRWLLGHKVANIIRGAAAVTAGSPYLEAYARRFNPVVHAVPTVVDVARYPVRTVESHRELRVGWIGSPSSSAYLELLRRPLTELARRVPVRLIAIGSRSLEMEGVAVEVRPWSEATELPDLLTCDVGVMPLPDEPWARGKCAFKLIQYMACGLPVVASPVGMNAEVVAPDCGFLPSNDRAWTEALKTLYERPELRAEMGEAGRRRAEERYSLKSVLPRVAKILEAAAMSRRRAETG